MNLPELKENMSTFWVLKGKLFQDSGEFLGAIVYYSIYLTLQENKYTGVTSSSSGNTGSKAPTRDLSSNSYIDLVLDDVTNTNHEYKFDKNLVKITKDDMGNEIVRRSLSINANGYMVKTKI